MITRVIRFLFSIILFLLLLFSCLSNNTSEEHFQNGLQLIKDGKKSTGYRLIKKAVQKAPKNFAYLRTCRDKNLLNSTGYGMLISMWTINYDFKSAEKMYKEAVRNGFCDLITTFESEWLIKECESSTLSQPVSLQLRARSYRKLGMKNATISAYEDVINLVKVDKSA